MNKKIVRQYIILSTLSKVLGLSLISATYMTFLLKNGLNLFEANLVNVVFYIVLFVSEIPTGAFADVYGRKKSYVISCLLISIGNFTYGLSHSFWGFALAESFTAIGMTFASGAFQAWLVDSLKHHGDSSPLQPIFSRVLIFSQMGSISGAIIGSYLATFNQTWPWFGIGFGMFFVMCLAQIIMKEEYFVRQKMSWRKGVQAIKDTAETSIRFGIRNAKIRYILLIGGIQVLAFQAPNMQWQPFFGKMIGGGVKFGFIYAGISLSIMLGAQIAKWVLKKSASEKNAIRNIQIVAGSFLAMSVLSRYFPIAITIFLLHELARGAFGPIKDAYLHDQIPSKERATIVSFESIAHHIGGAIGLVLSGLLANSAGIPITWAISGIVLVVGTIAISVNGKKDAEQIVQTT